jgi:MFS family permease
MPRRAAPAFLLPLAATLMVQTVGVFVSQTVPVVAPIMTAELGLAPERVGNLASLSTLGAILFLLFGTPFVAALGPARLLQWGLLLGAGAMALAASGIAWLLPLGALLMGVGYGPTGPAASRILHETAPPRHRMLIFSIKQAGAPAGGALAGLIAAPVAVAWGWQAAMWVAVAVGLLAAALLWPIRNRLDSAPLRPIPWREAFTWRRLGAPVAALKLHPLLPPLTLLAFAFAALQGSLFSFTVTWLVEAHGIALTAAGTVFATMLVAGVVGRLVLGWAADRTGDATRSLALHGLVAAALSALFILAAPGAPWGVVLLLAWLCGFTSASWNGIFLAEIARLSPPDRVAEASSGAIMLCFLGYLLAPTAFAFAVGATGGWVAPFLAACALLAAVALLVTARRGARGGQAE